MKNNIHLLIFFALMFSPLLALGISSSMFMMPDSFPHTWQGQYEGQLDIYTPLGLQQSVEMKLEIMPSDSLDRWIWAITYGPDSIKGRRSYELMLTDPEKGYYQIDEKNSILLDAHLLGNIFTSCFEVMDNLLVATYEKVGEEIIFSIIMSKTKSPITTGGEVIVGDTIPEVQIYPVGNRQRARLRKIK